MALSKKSLPIRFGLIFLLFCCSIALMIGCATIPQTSPRDVETGKEESKIEWLISFNDARNLAESTHKSMMLVFYGVSSKRLDENVFRSLEIIKLSKEFICVKLGSDQNELAKRYRIDQFPTFVFTDSQGGEYKRVVGYKSESSFVSVLKDALIPINVLYKVQVNVPQVGRAIVKCEFNNIRQKSLLMYIQEKANKPLNISYSSSDGPPAFKEIDDGVWQVEFVTSGMKTFSIQYETNLNVLSSMDFLPSYISYIGDDYGILDGHGIFITPQNLYINGKVRVQLVLTRDWKAITPWTEESPFLFSTNYIQEVTDSVFCIGNFQFVKKDFGEKELFIVYCGKRNIMSELNRRADIAVKLFNDYISRFGDFPFKKYLAIFADKTTDGKYIHGSAHGLGFAGPMEMPPPFLYQFIAHEIFHVWNGGIINQKSNYEVWFKEGFTQYYGYITPYRAGIYSEDQFYNYLNSDYQEYSKIYEAGDDMALARVNEKIARKEGHEQPESIRNIIMYRKGALVASLIDKEIKKATNGKKNVDDLIRYMINSYRDKSYSSDNILKSLNAITNQDWSGFFADFVYGRTKLPPLK
ncbi:MAG: M1 family aminopeptidase [Candidatus Poribacteria bacterium]